MTTFNEQMLILARESRGWSQADLARESGISQGHLSKIETGQTEPSEDLADKFADRLGVRSKFFRRKDLMRVLPATQFRKRQSSPRRELQQLTAYVNLVRMDVLRLLTALGLEWHFTPPQIEGDAVAVAQAVRQSWSVPKGPISDLVGLVEAAGILLVPLPEEQTPKKFDAMCVPDGDGAPPLIFYNQAMPTDRLRFTLAHELGHLVMHSLPTEEMEDEANAFASEFLVPASDVTDDLHFFNLTKAMQLKPRWRVSMAALVRRALDLGLINDNQYRYQQMQLSRSGYRKCEPIELSREEPRGLRRLLCRAAATLGSAEALARKLDVSAVGLTARYGFSVDDEEACREDNDG